jgi:poly-gamma-glutamate synthesis protein (capsule biosynthesis protein)
VSGLVDAAPANGVHRSSVIGRGQRWHAVVGVVAVLVALAGCGGGGGSSAADAADDATTTTAEVTTTTDAVTTTAPTTTTTTEPTTTTAPPPPGPATMTLAFAGDLLTHLPLVDQARRYGAAAGAAYDFGPMLAPMRPVLEPVDVAICHLEVPVAPAGTAPTGYPSFGAPGEVVDAVAAAGYDGCSTASNHSLDRGRAGIDATLARLDQAGLRHAGTARSAEEAGTTTLYEVDGAQVAHLSYAYGFNGYRLPADAPFAANQIDVGRIAADAAAARQRGADLVVVSLHWGTEYRHEPDAYQRDVAGRLLPSPDIDLVIGHHAHVVQPIEQVEGTYVVWGLGNQLANQAQVPRSDGLTVVVTAAKQPDGRYRVGGIEAVPTYVEAAGSYRVLPIVATLSDPTTPASRREVLAASYDRTAAVLATTPTPGVTVAPRP